MPEITILNLPEATEQRLRLRAAARGTSMEAEARAILVDALTASGRADRTWIEQLMNAGREYGRLDLEIPEDEPATVAEFHVASRQRSF
ncbi:MAG: toxin-antitoxin system antitoxin subunit [Dermatophilus congolensis]|nr:toxin-antitoxin system antitoxin subunit [Dermatophilus congolensis]